MLPVMFRVRFTMSASAFPSPAINRLVAAFISPSAPVTVWVDSFRKVPGILLGVFKEHLHGDFSFVTG